MNTTIMETARSILQVSGLDKEFWGYAVLTLAQIHNRLPFRSHRNISRLEHWTGKLPDIGHLPIFGATTWVHVPTEKRYKLDPKPVRYLLVGYEEDAGTRVYWLYDPIKKKLILLRDLIIYELSTISDAEAVSHTTSTEGVKEAPTTVSEVRDMSPEDFQTLDAIVPLLSPNEEPTGILESITVRPALAPQNKRLPGKRTLSATEQQSDSVPRRSQRMQTSGSGNSHTQFALLAGPEEEPPTLTEALNSQEKPHWHAAWESELTSLAQDNTWGIEPLPEGRSAIGSRWLFKQKDDRRYRARLVAKR